MDREAEKRPPTGTRLWYVTVTVLLVFVVSGLLSTAQVRTIPYSQFLSAVEQGEIDRVSINQQQISGVFCKGQLAGKHFLTNRVEPDLAQTLSAHKVTFEASPADNFFSSLFYWIISAAIFVGIWTFFMARFAGGERMGAGLLAIEKTKARVYVEDKIKVSFADVAGVDEAKEELKEVVRFLKEPEAYSRLGGRLPKGILLVGPPGTGKTLLARAVAGEAGVPFFSISGSEFVELFVGVGAARVRDLFAQARQKAPCIIFIDELDALGRARGLNPMTGSHDEKEQTLNQLLSELDGFDPQQGVVLLAATNRPEILDQALLRAGRFDRHILVDRPDRKGRLQILAVHARNIVLGASVNIEEIAALTAGFTGADLANLVNEAALLAARRQAQQVEAEDFTAAIERIVAGLEKKNRLLNLHERQVVAYHEMGHALVSLMIPGSDPIQKVSIIPRGIAALGYTMQRPTEDRFLMSRRELQDKMTVLLGGRASETIIFNEVSTGAADDLSKATEIARSMVTRYGMDEKLGLVAYENEPGLFLHVPSESASGGRRFSEKTAAEIDASVRLLVADAFERARAILQEHRQSLETGAQQLLDKETLEQEELLVIAGIGRIVDQPSQGQIPSIAAALTPCLTELLDGPAGETDLSADLGRLDHMDTSGADTDGTLLAPAGAGSPAPAARLANRPSGRQEEHLRGDAEQAACVHNEGTS